MIVQIAVEHERIRCSQRITRQHEPERRLPSLLELIEDRILIAKPELRVHQLSIHAGREAAVVGKGPALSEVGVVTLIQLESANPDVNQRAAVEVTKDTPRRFSREVWHQPTPHANVS